MESEAEKELDIHTVADIPRAAAHTQFSLVRGGPFYRLLQAVGLIHPQQWNLGRRIGALLAIAWLPMVVITAFSNRAGLHSLLFDPRVYARLWVAIPALIVGEVLMDGYFGAVLRHIREADLLDSADQMRMNHVLTQLKRLRDAFLPELIILLLAVVSIVTNMRNHAVLDTTPWLGRRIGDSFQFTAAAWYGVFVGAPLWNFLLGLALWRWLMWAFYAFKLSGCRLKLVASHPDKRGGLSFLGLMVMAFAPTAFAASSVIASNWRHEILHHGAHLADFKFPAIVLVMIIALLAVGPLLFFVPRLAALRQKGILEYGVLGQLHSSEYHEKWIHHRAGHEADFLMAPESNTLTGFGNSYEKIGQLSPFPIDMGSLYGLAAAVAIPGLVVVLAQIPFAVVLKELLKAVH
ncbi:MAG TPA: hypothetical protein VMF56_04275 [Acidobacteriaceae bacterium]|nr:hypothetical protein [Acidobacteriaceae bacterium]